MIGRTPLASPHLAQVDLDMILGDRIVLTRLSVPDVVLYSGKEQQPLPRPAQCHGSIVVFRVAVLAVLR